MANNNLEHQEQYFKNTIKYSEEMYNELTTRASKLSDEDEAERYIKVMLISSAQECLFKIREANSAAKQVFGKDFDVSEELIPLINELKPAFYFEGDKLMNVSGMEYSQMIEFIKGAITERNTKNAGGKDS